MYQKMKLVVSVIFAGIFMVACTPLTALSNLQGTGGGMPTPLSGQAQTEVASVVKSASSATQMAGKSTPVIAGSSNLTQGSSVQSPVGGTATASSLLSTAVATPGIMKPQLDWHTPWSKFLIAIPDNFYLVSVDELATQLASSTPPFLLDVREPSELTKYGYIRGAVNIPYKSVLTNLDKLPAQDKPIVVYSGTGHRGTIILSALRLLGYTKADLLDGGMSAWLKAKQSSETGMPGTPVTMKIPKVDQNVVNDLESFIDTGTYGIEAAQLNVWLMQTGKPVVVDVRERREISSTGAIKGSVGIPLKTLLDNLKQLPADKTSPIIVIDSNGHRGTIAMMMLRMIGYTNVRSLFGGIDAWVAAGLPITK